MTISQNAIDNLKARLRNGALCGLLVPFLFVIGAAAAPQLMNFQGRLTDTSGNPLTGTYSVQFSVWDTGPGTGGTELWSETQSLTSSNGIVSAQLGSATALPAGLFSSSNRWLEIKIGTNTALSPRQQLVSVAYSLDAASLDNGAVTPLSVSSGVYANITLPAGNLSGMIPDLNLDNSSVTLQGNLFNGPNELVQLTSGGKLPASVFNGSGALLFSTQTFTAPQTFESSVTVETSELVFGTVTAAGFAGNGAGLTNLNASDLSSGTLSDARLDDSSVTLQGNTFNGPGELVELTSGGKLPTSVFGGTAALLPSTQTFSGQNTFLSSVAVNNVLFMSSGVVTNSLNVGGYATLAGGLSAGGNRINNVASPVSPLDAVNLQFLTGYTGGLGAAVISATQTFTGANSFASNSVFIGSVTINNALGASSETISNTLVVGGGVTASSFTGIGTNLTNLNASNLSTGAVPDARLDNSSVTLQGNTFNGANELVLLNSNGLLPPSVFSGAAALLASSQTFTGSPLFQSSVTINNLLGLNGNRIINVGVPVSTGDAVNLFYLNATTASAVAEAVYLATSAVQIQVGASSNTFTAAQTFDNTATYQSSVTVNSLLGASSETIVNTLNVGGSVIALNFTGNGTNLTNLSASNLSTGTVPDARLDNSSVTLQGNTFNGANELVLLNSNGFLPPTVFNGSAALLASSQTFTGSPLFQSSVTINNLLGLNGNRIINVGVPVSTGDAVNLFYLNASTTSAVAEAVYLATSAVVAVQSTQVGNSSNTFTAEQTFNNTATYQSSVTVNNELGVSSETISNTLVVGEGVTASSFTGNGSALTNLNASNITSGALGATGGEVTVNLSSLTFTGLLPAQYVQFSGAAALLASSQTFTGSPLFESSVTINNLLGLNWNRIINVGAPLGIGDAVNLGYLNASTTSAVAEAVYLATSSVAAVQSTQVGNSSNTFTAEQTFNNTATYQSSVTVNNELGVSSETITNTLVVGGGVTASSFTGNGSALTNLTANNITSGGTFLAENASALTNLTAINLTAGGTFPAENGSALTNLNASNITSGSLGATGGEVTVNLSSLTFTGLLPAQYVQFSGAAALLASSQTFTGSPLFESSVTINNLLGLNGNRIINVGAPLGVGDAVNLGYLNTSTASAVAEAVYLATSSVAAVQSTQVGNSSNTFTAEQTFNNTATYQSSVTVNNELGVSSETITNTLVVGGGVTASSFTGNGSALTNLTANNISAGGTFLAENASALTNLTAINLTAGGTFPVENGSALTNLNASNITSGSLGATGGEVTVNLSSLTFTGLLPAQYVQFSGAAALLASSQTFTGSPLFQSSVTINNLLGLNGNRIINVGAPLGVGDAVNLGYLNASTSSAVAEAVYLATSSVAAVQSTQVGNSSNTFTAEQTFNNTATYQSSVTVNNELGVSSETIENTLVVGGGVTASSFTGNGSALTNLTANNISAGGTFLAENASALTNLTAINLTAGGTFPAENGSALTNLNASNITSGALGATGGEVTVNLSSLTFTGLLPAQYVQFSGAAALLASSQTFTGSPLFESSVTINNLLGLNGSRIINVGAPLGVGDAVNLGYLNTSTAAAAAYAISQAAGAASSVVTGATNTFTAEQTFGNTATFASSVTVNNVLGASSETIANTLVVGEGVTASSFTGNGAALNSLNAGALTTGIVGSNLLPSTVAYTSIANTFTSSQTFTNGINAGNKTINGVAAPVLGTDAVNLTSMNTATATAAAYAISQAAGAASSVVTGATNTFTAQQTFGNTATFASSVTVNNILGASSETITNTLTVGGGVTASSFTGNGSALTNLTAGNIASGGTFLAENGSALTSLNAGNLTTGIIGSNLLPSTVAYTSIANTFVAGQVFTNGLNASNGRITNVGVPLSTGDAVNLLTLNTATASAAAYAISQAAGAASSVVTGTTNTFTAEQTFGNTTTFGSSVTVNNVLGASSETITDTLTVGEGVTASSFTGNGAALTNLTAGNIASGGTFLAENGSALTSLNAGNLTTGIIGSNLLPSTVAYTSIANTFVAGQVFTNGLNASNGRITNVGVPLSTGDAVNLLTLNTATASAAAYAISQAAGAASSVVTGTTNTFTAEQTFGNTTTFGSSVTVNNVLGASSETITDTLTVGEGVTASSFTGNGAALTNLTAGNIASGGTFLAENGSALTSLNAGALTTGIIGSNLLPSTVAYTSIANTFTSSQTFTNGINAGNKTINGVAAPVLGTDAVNLTSMNTATATAAAYAIGQAAGAASSVVTGTTNTFTAQQTFGNTATFASSVTVNNVLHDSSETITNTLTVGEGVTASSFTGNGAALTNLTAGNIASGGTFLAENGSALTFLNAGALTTGTVGSNLLPSTVAYTSIANTFAAGQVFTSGLNASNGRITNVGVPVSTGDAVNLLTLNTATASAAAYAISQAASAASSVVTGATNTFTAEQTFGNTATFASSVTVNNVLGASSETIANTLTVGEGVTASSFTGNGAALTNLTAGNIASGGTFLAENGSALTSLNAGAMTTGIVGSNLLPSTVAYTSIANTFTSSQTFTNGINAGNKTINGVAAPVLGTDAVNLTSMNTATAAAAAYAIGQAAGAASSVVTGATNTFTAQQTFGNTATFGSSVTVNNVLGASSETITNTLTVGGGVTASSFTGNGAALTNLTAGNIASGGTFLAENGSALTSLNAGALTTGIIGSNLLPSTVAYTSIANTFTSSQTFTNGINAGNKTINGVAAPVLGTDAVNLTSMNTATAAAAAYAIGQATAISASGITATSNTFTALQTFNNTATFNSSVTVNNVLHDSSETITNTLTVGEGVTASSFTGSGAALTNLTAGNIASGGTFLSENGAALTNLNAANVGGTLGTGATLNLTNLAYSGTMSGSNISGGTFGAVNGSALTSLTAGNITANGTFLTENASALTNLNAAALTGSLPSGVLPSTVAYTNKDNSFSTTETFGSSITVNGNLGTTGQITAGTGNTVITTAAGLLDATKLTGNLPALNGSLLTNLNAGSLASGGTFLAENGSALTNLSATNMTSGTLGTGVTLNLTNLAYSGTLTGSDVSGGTFGAVNGSALTNLTAGNIAANGTFAAENGSALTSLNAGALTSGVVSSGLLPSTVAYSNKDNNYTSEETYGSSMTVTGNFETKGVITAGTGNTVITTAAGLLDATKLTGNLPALNGASLTSLSAGNLTASGTFPAENASALTNLNAAALTGNLPSGVLPSTVAYTNKDNSFSTTETFGSSITVNGNLGTTGQITAGTGNTVITTAAGLLDATKLTGNLPALNGSLLTNLNAGSLASGGTFLAENGSALTNLSATNMTSGTLGTGVTLNLTNLAYSGTLTGSDVSGGTFGAVNGSALTSLSAGNLTANGTFPAENASALTSLNAAALTGSLPGGVLPSTVAYTNKDNSFSTTETFGSSITVNGNLGTTGQITAGTGNTVITTAAGLLDATKLTGNLPALNGSLLTNLNAGSLASGGTFLAENGAALTNLSATNMTSGTLGTGVTLNLTNLAYSGTLTGSDVSGGTFGAVNGSALTSLTAGNLTANGTFPAENASALTSLNAAALTGSLPGGVLPSTVAYTNKDNSFSTTETFGSSITVNGNLGTTGQITAGTGNTVITTAAGLLDATKLTGNLPALNGSLLTNLNAGSLASGGTFLAENGSALTNLSATNMTSGTLGTGVTLNLTNLAYSGTLTGSDVSGGTFGAVNGSALTSLSAGNLTASGTFPAENASALTNLNAAALTGNLPSGVLPSTVAYTNKDNSFSTTETFGSSITVNGNLGTTGQITAGTGNTVITTAAGLLDATKLTGNLPALNGSLLTNLNAGSLASGGTFLAENGSALTNLSATNMTSGTLGTGVTLNLTNLAYSGTLTGSDVSGGTFGAVNGSALTNLTAGNIAANGTFAAENGSALTSLNAGALTSGVVSSGLLPSTVAYSNKDNNYTSEETYGSSMTVTGNFETKGVITAGTGNTVITTAAGLLDATKLTGNLPALNGASLTSLSAGNLTASGTFPAENASALTNLNAAALTGNLPSGVLPSTVAYTNKDNSFSTTETFGSSITVNGNLGTTGQITAGTGNTVITTAAGLLDATKLTGNLPALNGSLLTNLNAGSLASGGTFLAENGSALTNLSATNMTSGTLGTGVTLNLTNLAYSGTLTGSDVSGGTFGAVNGSALTSLSAGNLTANGTFPAENASALTSLNAAALTGSLPGGVLPSTVAYTNKDNSFSTTETFGSSITVNGNLGTTGQITAGTGNTVITTAAGLLDATKLTGNLPALNGSLLTNLNAGSLASGGTFLAENGAALTNLSATNMTSGTLGTGVTLNLTNLAYSGTLTGSDVSGGTFGAVNGSALTSLSAGNLTASGTFPAENASALTNLNAAALTGNLPSGVLPSTVAYTNKDNSFSTTETFGSSITVNGNLGTTGQITAGTGNTVITTAAGLLDATKLTGNLPALNGSLLTNLNAGSLASGGTFLAENGSALTNLSATNMTSGTLGTGVTLNLTNLAYSGTLTGSDVSGGTFGAVNGSALTNLTAGNIAANGTFAAENGSALTSLNAGALTSGVVSSGLLPSTVAYSNKDNNYTSEETYGSSMTVTGNFETKGVITAGTGNTVITTAAGLLDATKLTGNLPALNGASLTSLSAGNLTASGTFPAENASALTNLNAAALTGNLPSGVLPSTVAYTNKDNSFSTTETFGSSITVNGNLGTTGQITAGTGNTVITTAAGLLDATKLTGNLPALNGSLLTNLNAGSLASGGTFLAENGSALTNLSATNMTSGTLGTGVTLNLTNLAYSGTLTGSDVSGGTFGAVNGSALTNLNAGALASGTVASGVLPSTVDYTTVNATISGVKTYSSSATFTASGANQFSIQTSSGIDVSTGVLIVGNGANISEVTPTGFIGNGSGLTNITASAIAAGNITAGGTFLAENASALTNLSAGNLTAAGTFPAENGSALTNLGAANIAANGTFLAENGSALTALNAGALTSGTVASGVLPSTVDYTTVNATISGVKTYSSSVTFTASGANQFSIQTSSGIDVSTGVLIVGNGANISQVTPTGFIGNGSGLTNVTASAVAAGAITGTGVVASTLLPSTVAYTASTQTFTAPQTLSDTATFTATGLNTYSLGTSSGIYMGAGYLDINGTAGFGAGATVSTFTSTGNLQMTAGSTITANGFMTLSTSAVVGATSAQTLTLGAAGVGIGGAPSTGAELTVQNPGNGTPGLMLTTTGTKPTCAAAYRGGFFMQQGTPDILYICMQMNSAGSYQWVQVARGQ